MTAAAAITQYVTVRAQFVCKRTRRTCASVEPETDEF